MCPSLVGIMYPVLLGVLQLNHVGNLVAKIGDFENFPFMTSSNDKPLDVQVL